MPDHGHPISSPCKPNGSGELKKREENGPRASSAPALGLNTIIFKHVY